eukprot:CFRG0673T1
MKIIVFMLSFTFAAQVQSLVASTQNNRPTLHVYGGSVSDAGFTYKMTEGAWPPPFYDKRFSNGHVWVEYMTEAYGYNLHSISRGSASSNTSVVIGFTGPSFTWPVFSAASQIEQNMIVLQNAKQDVAMNTSSKNANVDIHLLCAGTNDLYFKLQEVGELNYEENQDAYVNTSVTSLANAARYLMDNDNVQSVAVCNGYPASESPYVVSQGPVYAEQVKLVEANFVKKMNSTILEMANEYPDKTMVLVPMFDVAHDSISTFKYTTACLNSTSAFNATICENPEDHFFWDIIHPTTVAHKKLADALGPVIFTKQN